MSDFADNHITNLGTALLARVMAGEGGLTFTRIVLGDGNMPSSQSPATMTDVVSPKAEASITKAVVSDGQTAVVGARFTNEEQDEAFTWRELGLYAKVGVDASDVLYSYGYTPEGELIPAGTASGTLVEKLVDVVTYVGDAAEVTAIFDPDFIPQVSRIDETAIDSIMDQSAVDPTTGKSAQYLDRPGLSKLVDEIQAAIAGAGPTLTADEVTITLADGSVITLKDGGVMAIVQDASPLYKGKPESGEDCVRRYILENDWLDAIVQLPTDSFYNTGIATYIWLLSKGKPYERKDKVLLVDASRCFEKRRKGIGDKKNDITKVCRDLIVKAYGAYTDGVFSDTASNGSEIVCETRVMETVEFGFNRVAVETPLYDEGGKPVFKKGKPVANKAKEDTEDIPLNQDIDAYIEREVKPYNPDAWVDPKKAKVGYTIPFTRVFYRYRELEPADDIAKRILEHEKELEGSLEVLFGEGR